jgi:nucleoside-diphosphate-sugar epimerase
MKLSPTRYLEERAVGGVRLTDYLSPTMSSPNQPLFLVTGAAGFIVSICYRLIHEFTHNTSQGSHVVKALLEQGKRVRTTDIVAMSPAEENSGDFIQGDLRDRSFAFRICSGVHSILHFAANMGGMGTIHAANDGVIYADNSMMVQNILLASLESGVHRFLYSSSACVYPHDLQDDLSKDVALSEEDAWKLSPPQAQGLYGQEKLVSEL